MFFGNMLIKQKNEEYKNNQTHASFTAWQILTAGYGIKESWEKYAKQCGLGNETPKASKESVDNEIEQSYENARKIQERALNYEMQQLNKNA